jgi:hypothetical protein
MLNWRNWIPVSCFPLAIGGFLGWDSGELSDWRYLVALLVVSLGFSLLPFGIYQANERRKARSYEQLLARVR